MFYVLIEVFSQILMHGSSVAAFASRIMELQAKDFFSRFDLVSHTSPAFVLCRFFLQLTSTIIIYSIFSLFILPDLTDHRCSWTIDTPVDELVMRMQCCDDMTICIQHVRRRACFRKHL